MSFLNDLKEMRQDAIENVAGIDIDIEATKLTLEGEQQRRAFWTKRIAEIDTAIAALEPAPTPESETHSETIGPFTAQDFGTITVSAIPELTQDELDAAEFEPGDASEFAEPDDEATRAAAIELTADVEPEIQALIESGEHSYDEVAAIAYPEPQWNEPQTEGYAPVTNPTIDDLIPEAMRQELEAEQRYAQPTNPEADFWSRGLAPSEPEKKHRFSIFGHKRETEDA
jgi:hypothetical protein